MAGSTPRLPASERRDLLLAAAGRCFAERGYELANLEEIARGAGVTKPILYRHFASKKELYLTLLRRHRDDMPGFVADAPMAGTEPGAAIAAIVDRWLLYAAENPHGWSMIFRDPGGDAEIRAFRRSVSDAAREVLRGFLERAPVFAVPPEELEPTAEILRSGLAGGVLWWLEHPETPRAVLARAITRLLDGLAAAA